MNFYEIKINNIFYGTYANSKKEAVENIFNEILKSNNKKSMKYLLNKVGVEVQ